MHTLKIKKIVVETVKMLEKKKQGREKLKKKKKRSSEKLKKKKKQRDLRHRERRVESWRKER